MKRESATPAEERAMSAWRSMIRATMTAMHIVHRHLHEHGLRGPQFGVIAVIGEAGPDGLKLSHISRELCVTPANVTGLVDRLEESGYVTREPDPEDRRVFRAKLTPKGQKFLEEVMPAHRAHVVRVMSCLTDEEQAELARLLSRVAARAAAMAEEQGDDDP